MLFCHYYSLMSDGQLRQIFAKHLPTVHWVAIESPSTSRGIPDLNGCFNGVEVWIEMKVTNGNKVSIRKEQIAWMERRARARGRIFVAVRQRDRLWLLSHRAPRLLFDGKKLSNLPNDVVLWSAVGGPASWPWPIISRIIFDTT